jgi:Spy/CpxP family protein refolding chaperone
MQEATMKKVVTTVLMVVATVLLCSISLFGQAAQPSPQSTPGAEAQPNSINDKDVELLRANLRANRKELMARNMNLSADEATKFWPVFDQYRKEAIKPNDERWALIKEYAANYNTMTDAQAQDYMKRAVAVDQQLLALRLKYVPVLRRSYPPRRLRCGTIRSTAISTL